MDVADAQILEETTYLDDSLTTYIVGGIDVISKDHKAKFITDLLKKNDFVKDPAKIDKISKEHGDVINAYLNQIDYVALSQTGPGVKVVKGISEKLKLIAIPASIGALIGIWIAKKYYQNG